VNLELSRTLAAQEKFALLGEITSGIAHDLNTPLSSIKVGAENVHAVLNELFKNVILRCNPDQIAFAFERVMTVNSSSLQTGAQQRAEISETRDFLEVELKYEPSLAKRLAPLICKAGLKIEDRESLIHVLNSENPELFLELISLLHNLRMFTGVITSSSERAAKVVQNLRQFMRGSASFHLGTVNLRENIETVLNIFQHELKHKVQLSTEWAENLFIKGYENRLFQLWSNLIKNALEALAKGDIHEKWIWVKTEYRNHEIAVIVGNNGPAIPESISNQIFDKFFTTKHDHGGTGLGLSIVRSIIDDHNAQIVLRSNQEQTEFEVIFNL
jgi:signal transduction histidine kinase